MWYSRTLRAAAKVQSEKFGGTLSSRGCSPSRAGASSGELPPRKRSRPSEPAALNSVLAPAVSVLAPAVRVLAPAERTALTVSTAEPLGNLASAAPAAVLAAPAAELATPVAAPAAELAKSENCPTLAVTAATASAETALAEVSALFGE